MRRPAGSWSNDQLSSAFAAPAARLSSRTVQQNQKWSPELPYSSRTGPAQQRADEQQKAATSPLQPRLQGQKISQGVIKGYRGGQPAHPGSRPRGAPHTDLRHIRTIASYLRKPTFLHMGSQCDPAKMNVHPDKARSTCSYRCADPAQESINMVDDMVRVCAAHPRASLTSQTCLADVA